MSDIVITTLGLDEVIRRFNGMPAQIATAKKRALAKTVKAVSVAASREIAAGLSVAQKAIKKRIATRAGANSGLVWFGLQRLDASKIGRLRQTLNGARAAKYDFPGAFIKSIYSADEKIWIRLSSRKYDAERYPYKNRGGLYGHAGNSFGGRFPVVKATIAIDTPATRAIIAAQAKKAGAILADKLDQELNYEINVKGAR